MNLSTAASGKSEHGNYAIRAVIAAACLVVYGHCLFYGITNSDDDILLAKNLAFLQHLPNLFTVFTTDAFYLHKSIDLYRPLQSATFILDGQWGVNTFFAAHLTNLILHLLACLTMFRLLRLLEFRQNIAFLGALLYAVHYLFMTAVAWLPARGDLLLALFVFLSLTSFIRIFTTGGWLTYLQHAVFFTLAIFSKESGVILPAILALYLWAYCRTGLLRRCHLVLPLFYVAAELVYFKLKSLAVVLYQGDIGVIPLLKNSRTLPETVAKFYLPLNISTLPAFQLSATSAGILIICGLALFHWRYRRRFDRRVLFYAGWTLLFMLPGMLYYPAFYSFAYEHLDHRSYITCFGLLLLNLNIVQTFDLDSRQRFTAVCLLLLIYLAAFNFHFSRSYQNPAEFALRAIKTNPRSALAYQIYGTELYLQGRDDEALASLNRSIGIFGKYTEALLTRALVYRRNGLNREALADLYTIVAFEPAYSADVYVLRGGIKIDLQDYAGAESDFMTALRLEPHQPGAVSGLQLLDERRGR